VKFSLSKRQHEGEKLPNKEVAPARGTDSQDRGSPAYERFWLVLCMTAKETLPRHDLFLCLNERCELAYFVLPEFLVTTLRTRTVYDHPDADVALFQRISNGKDDSVLSPALYSGSEVSRKSTLVNSYNNGDIEFEVRKPIYKEFVAQVMSDSISYLGHSSLSQPLRRAHFIDNYNIVNPDNLAPPCSRHKVPLPAFIYTFPHNELEFDKQRFERTLYLRHYIGEQYRPALEKMYEVRTEAQHWLNDRGWMLETISCAEAELLKLHDPFWKEFTEEFLEKGKVFVHVNDPTFPHDFKGKESRLELEQSTKQYFSIGSWGEHNIAQIIMHVGEQQRVSLPDERHGSMRSPGVTVFRDELGIHTLPTYLFLVSENAFTHWQSMSKDTPQSWWQTDKVARGILWLVAEYLFTHEMGNPSEAVFSVTPIGDNAIQVNIVEGHREEGTPYAYAVIRDEMQFSAVPIFPSGVYEYRTDGTAISKSMMSLKNFIVTREGERRETLESTHFVKPIYSVILSGRSRAYLHENR